MSLLSSRTECEDDTWVIFTDVLGMALGSSHLYSWRFTSQTQLTMSPSQTSPHLSRTTSPGAFWEVEHLEMLISTSEADIPYHVTALIGSILPSWNYGAPLSPSFC